MKYTAVKNETERCDLSVIMFGYNEAPSLAKFLPEVLAWQRAHALDVELVYVDDGSDDQTLELVKTHKSERFCVVSHEASRGIGAAIKTGMLHSNGDAITFLPADGQLACGVVDALVAKQRERDADIVFSVYTNPHGKPHRSIMSWGVRFLILSIFGVRVRSDGPYLVRAGIFDANQLASNSFFLNFEFPLRAKASQAFSFDTVYVAPRARYAGKSKSANWRTIRKVATELVRFRQQRLGEKLRTFIG